MMAAETISVRDLTAAHIGRTFDGKKIIAISRGRAVWIFFEGYSLPEGFHCRADGTWPTVELDVDPWADVPLPERWVVQFGRVSTVDYPSEETARRLFDSFAPPVRLVHLSAAGAVIAAVKP